METLYQDKQLTNAQINLNLKWIEALKSGEYKQAKNVLFDGERYCCLGVACKIAGLKAHVEEQLFNPLYAFGTPAHSYTLPESIQKKLGLRTDNGVYGNEKALSADNDEGKTFKQIAKIIENQLNKKIEGKQ